MFQRLSDNVLVSGQIGPADMTAIAAAGVSVIVNNRPDDEEPGQPAGAEIEAAARAAGIGYHHIPVSAGFEPELVAAMAAAMEEGNILAFCHTGTRSAYIWALARAGQGADAADTVRRAAQAGFNVRPLLPWLTGAQG